VRQVLHDLKKAAVGRLEIGHGHPQHEPGSEVRKEERMKTRRELLLGVFVVFLAATGAARAAQSGPLDVTYYYLPG
jgi:hypothetical protein